MSRPERPTSSSALAGRKRCSHDCALLTGWGGTPDNADTMSHALTVVFGVTLFLASLLLFLLQPMFGRMVLPLLGGAPAVWNTCLVFFQLTLLLGYLYAWASSRWLARRAQAGVHAALLIVAAVVLPVRIVPGWGPPAEANPIPWLLGVLTVSIGLPFFVVSTTAPMLQHWFAQTEHPDAEDPYFLYQASNLGSLVALLAYPVAVEPWLGLRHQGVGWSLGYALFVVLVGVCAWYMLRVPAKWQGDGPSVAIAQTPQPKAHAPAKKKSRIPNPLARRSPVHTADRAKAAESRIPASRLLRWIALAAVPSSLLMGVTTYLSTDVAVVPLLWVVPLALYLLTFVIAFARRPLVPERVTTAVLPVLIVPLVIVLVLRTTEPAWAIVPLHLVTFALAALVCHGQLAAGRPPASQLTLFYLCLSIGGAAGGLFNALVAPLLFDVPFEYPLALAAAGLLKPYRAVKEAARRFQPADAVLPALLGLAAAAVYWLVGRGEGKLSGLELPLAVGLPAFVCYVFSPRPIRFGLAVLALLVAGLLRPVVGHVLVDVDRSFFGIHRVMEDRANNLRLLFHGNTLHGVQSLDAAKARDPQAYYTREGPAGQIFREIGPGAARSVAVVGLGAGALAALAQPGDTWTFLEIDPVVVRLARDAKYFTYLRDSPARVDVVVGDARLSLAKMDGPFDVIVLDAFSSDAVPVHLLTREALQLYLARLKPGGVLAFHASSRFLRLRPVFAGLAKDAGLADLREFDKRDERRSDWSGWTPSEWVLMARSRADFGGLTDDTRWGPIEDEPARVWTDDYANVMAAFRWR